MQLIENWLFLSPSDVTGYLGCEHLTTLSVRVAPGEFEMPRAENEQAELVFRKGLEHEADYLAQLRAAGKDVVEIRLGPDYDWERAARETEDALTRGVDGHSDGGREASSGLARPPASASNRSLTSSALRG